MATSFDNPYPSTATAVPAPADDTNGLGIKPNSGTDGDMLGRLVRGAHATIDRLADSATPHVRRLQERAASAKDAMHVKTDRARELGDEWTESLRGTVRENPLTAVATALALGALISRLTRR